MLPVSLPPLIFVVNQKSRAEQLCLPQENIQGRTVVGRRTQRMGTCLLLQVPVALQTQMHKDRNTSRKNGSDI
jgi:hypothetical protein